MELKKRERKKKKSSKSQGEIFHQSSMRRVGTARYDHTNLFDKYKHVFTHVLPRISGIALGLALLEDEQKFKLGGCVGAHKMSISCTNISSECMK
jgi:hypothetical protein